MLGNHIPHVLCSKAEGDEAADEELNIKSRLFTVRTFQMLGVLMLQVKQLVKMGISNTRNKFHRDDVLDISCSNAAGEAAGEDSLAVPCDGVQKPQGSSS